MGSSSHDIGAELRMHYFTVDCDTFSNDEKVAVEVEVTCSEAMLAPSLCTLLVKCLMKRLRRSSLG